MVCCLCARLIVHLPAHLIFDATCKRSCPLISRNFLRLILSPDADLPAPPLHRRKCHRNAGLAASQALLEARAGTLDAIPIDHLVKPAEMRGGHTAARSQMAEFLKNRFPAYSEEHNKPELRATSSLSPYLHFGHISAHEIFAAIVAVENWRPEKLALRSNGAREGWWNMSAHG